MVEMETLAKLILTGIAMAAIVYGIVLYNRLIEYRRNIEEAWANIEVLLKQRNHELPKLVDAVAEHVGYERNVLTELTEARTRAQEASTPDEEAAADAEIRRALARIRVLAEDHPELQASQTFQQLQARISAVEDQIADRRDTYNAETKRFNIRIHQVPYNLLRPLMGYRTHALFEVPEDELEDIDVAAPFPQRTRA